MILYFKPNTCKSAPIPSCCTAQCGANPGPGGQDGMVYSDGNGRTGYYPDNQKWTKVNDWWLGVSREKINPDTLLRDEVVDGHFVKLEDGNEWLIPVARVFPIGTNLPESLVLGPDGQLVKEILPRFAAFTQKADEVFEFFRKEKGLLQTEAWEIAVEALAINYHVGRQEVSALRLLTTANIAKIMQAIIDMPTAMAAEKKKIEQADADSLTDGKEA